MDFDPRFIYDEIGYCGGPGSTCNFHFGLGYDVIEEDAENEKSCVQVLKYMIAKADDEIHDLEDELAILQCQLKWNECDKKKNDRYEATIATFNHKIDSLSSSIQRLKDENGTRKHVIDESLKIQGPAERIFDIIDTLIKNDFSYPVDQDKQCEVTNSEELSSDATRYEAKDTTTEEICMSKSDETITTKDEVESFRCSSEDKSAALPIKPDITKTPLLVSLSAALPEKPDITKPPLLASPTKESSIPDGLTQGKSEVCQTESENGESGSSSLSVKKAEKVNYATIAIGSFTTLQDYGRDVPIENDLKRKSHSDLGVTPQCIPTPMVEPLEVIEKWDPTSNSENSTKSASFLKKEEGSLVSCKSNNKSKKVGDIIAKKQRIQRVKKENTTIVTPVSDLDDLKQKISRDPDFLKRLKVSELKDIAKQNKLLGLSKSKKEQMIDEIIKCLGP